MSMINYYVLCLSDANLRESSSSSSDASDVHHGTREVALKMSALQSLHAKGENGDTSTYALNGTDKSRLKNLLNSPSCPCKCSMPYKVIASVCASFWSLPKEHQDALLWSVQCESGRGKSKFSIEGQCLFKVVWVICYCLVLVVGCIVCFEIFGEYYLGWSRNHHTGHYLCRESWLKLLGIGKQRLQRTKKRFRGIDDRTLAHGCLVKFTNKKGFLFEMFCILLMLKMRGVCGLFSAQFFLFIHQVEMRVGASKQLQSKGFSVTSGGQQQNQCQSSCIGNIDSQFPKIFVLVQLKQDI